MNIKISKIKIISFLMLLFMLLSSLLSQNIDIRDNNYDISNNDNISYQKELKVSRYWDNFTFIHILDGNWSKGINGGWIQGDGSYNNPYRIENMTIDATDTPNECGILIENSQNDYIIIKNCTVNNAAGVNGAGIKLSNTNNVTLRNNNCSNNNPNGIFIENGVNNTIANNYMTGCEDYGIHTDNANFTLILGNIAIDNNLNSIGIGLWNSNNNTIEENYISGNFNALYLNGCSNNTIKENQLAFSDNNGIWVRTGSINNTISQNLVLNNSFNGIVVDSDSNLVVQNLIENNTARGLYITTGMKYSQIFYNVFKNNGIHAEDSGTNNHWNSSNIGNFWDNYTGLDQAPRDGIGDTSYNYIIGTANNEDFLPLFENPMFNGSRIYIDDKGNSLLNWSRTALLKWWCKGSGTKNNPYILEDLIIDANQIGSGIIINNSQVFFTIRNCVIYNSSSTGSGILIENTENGIISENLIINNTGYGIYIDPTNDTVISNNYIYNNTYGIYLEDQCNGNLILNNTFYKNQQHGIVLVSLCTNNTIKQNNITENNYGIYLNTNSENNSIIDNDIIKNTRGISVNGNSHFNRIRNNRIEQSTNTGVFLDGYSHNITIENNNITNTAGNGIYLSNHCTDTKILVNQITYSNIVGIYLINTIKGTQIIGNNISHNGQSGTFSGIEILSTSTYNNIANNNIKANSENGIKITGLVSNLIDHNTIHNNNISNNTLEAIYLKNIQYTNITNNRILNNDDQGIYLENAEFSNIISNNVSKNGNNILENGIYVYLSNNFTISNNTVNTNNGAGISLARTDDTTIANNTMNSNVRYGLYLSNCDNNVIFNNIINNNGLDGFHLTNDCDRNNFTANLLNDNSLKGIYIDTSATLCDENLIVGNILNNNPLTIEGGVSNINTINIIDGICNNISIDAIGETPGSVTWEEALDYVPWFSGSGIWADPYIIENLNIENYGVGSAVLINNSKTVYFIIRNSMITTHSTGDYNAAIKFMNVNNGVIFNNTCYNCTAAQGIFFTGDCDNNTIERNRIYNSVFNAIHLQNGCDNNTITMNNCTNNSFNGVYIQDSNENIISWNNLSSNLARGIRLYGDSDLNVITHNLIKNSGTMAMHFNGVNSLNGCDQNIIENNTIDTTGVHGISFENYCRKNNISNNLIQNCGQTNPESGIYLEDNCGENIIFNNTIWNSGYAGVYITIGCNDNMIKNNTISFNQRGIYLVTNSGSNTISFNHIFNNSDSGIAVGLTCNGIIITYNEIYNNTLYGIHLYTPDNCIIAHNIINQNTEGIRLQWSCTGNLIRFNDIKYNSHYGTHLFEENVNGNTFWYNNFTGNGIANVFDEIGGNNWDNTSHGNYWDDYTGRDIDDNGIGDTPYTKTNVVDNYPLWDDGDIAPFIFINYPSNNTHWAFAPMINISVYDPSFGYLWYNVSGDKEFLVPGVAEQLRSDIWNGISENSWFIIEIYANDTTGNLNGTLTLRMYKDTIAPLMQLNSVANFSTVNDLFAIEVIVSDLNFNYAWYNVTGLTGREFLKNNTVELFNATKFWNLLDIGWFTIEFYANDTSGNINNSFTLILYKDTRAPWLTISGPANFSSSNNAPYFSVSASDKNLAYIWYNITGLPEIEFLANDTNEQLNLTKYWNNLGQGWYTINFYANDTYGLLNNTYSLILYKDINSPWITINSPVNLSSTNIAPIINIIASDLNLHYIWYTVDGQAGQEFLLNNTGVPLLSTYWDAIVALTWFTIRIYANDTFGQINNTYTLSIYKDNQPPVFEKINLENYTIYSKSPEILVEVKDTSLHFMWYKCNGIIEFLINDTAEDLLNEIWGNLDEGEFQIILFANDTSGAESNTTIILIKDTKAPTLKITEIKISDLEDITETANVIIKWILTDVSNITLIEIKLGDNSWKRLDENQREYSFEKLETGTYTIKIRAVDSANHTTEESDTFNIEHPAQEPAVEWGMIIIVGVTLAGSVLGIIFFIRKTKQLKLRE
ncbi:MAG: right-handed parallel beta-helix repeat-containing protein [Promethearchaeota archaeon]